MTPDQVPATLGWGACAGIVVGLAYARFGQRQHRRVNFVIIPLLGIFCLGLFLFHLYIGNPNTRRLPSLGFVGAALLVGTPIAWYMMPFYRRGKRPPRREASE